MAKMPTPQQAEMFHLAQTGFPQCFANCCLCNAVEDRDFWIEMYALLLRREQAWESLAKMPTLAQFKIFEERLSTHVDKLLSMNPEQEEMITVLMEKLEAK